MLGVSAADAENLRASVATRMVLSAVPHRPDLRQFLVDTMDPMDRPLEIEPLGNLAEGA